MNKTILQKIFDGELFPSEVINPDKTNPESSELNRSINYEKKYFSGLLSDSDKKRLDKFIEMQNLSSGIYGSECFTYGFRLGAFLLIEVLHDIHNSI